MATWRALLWKEFHEHKWKSIALFAIVISIPTYSLLFAQETFFGTYAGAIVIYTAIAGIFLAMHTVAHEKSQGTLAFLQGLPGRAQEVAVAKLIAAIVCVCIPIITMAAGYSLVIWLTNMEFPHVIPLPTEPIVPWMLSVAGFGCVCSVGVYIWTVFLARRSQTELQVGRTGVLALAIWSAVVIGVNSIQADISALPAAIARLWDAIGPPYNDLFGAISGDMTAYTFGVWSILIRLITFAFLAGYFVKDFGRLSTVVDQPRRSLSDTTAWLGAPRKSAVLAIAWKQFREAAPFVLSATAIVLVLSVIVGLGSSTHPGMVVRTISSSLIGFTIIGGFVLAVLLGVGTFCNDMRRPLRSFWQAQPINPDLWFWMKFLTGAAAVVAGLLLPVVVAAFLGGLVFADGIVMSGVLLLGIAYASAVLMMCVVRQPIYAGILATPLTIGVGMLFSPSHLTMRFGFDAADALQISVASHSAMLVACIIVSWLSVRYDWGFDQ